MRRLNIAKMASITSMPFLIILLSFLIAYSIIPQHVLAENQHVTIEKDTLQEEMSILEMIVPVLSASAYKNHLIPDTLSEPVTGMDFVYVKGGCYDMGCGDWAEDCEADETPVHEVCVNDFLMGQYEVTIDEYRQFLLATGDAAGVDFTDEHCPINNDSSYSLNGNAFGSDNTQPMVEVSWEGTVAFAEWLSSQTGLTLRLSTEAEWEYAARCGGLEEKYAGGDDANSLAWYGEASDTGATHVVGTKTPNGLSIYDMSGNVWEWCSDWYDSAYYASSTQDNPQGPSSGDYRVKRGGCWKVSPVYIRCANRGYEDPSNTGNHLGFRLVMEPYDAEFTFPESGDVLLIISDPDSGGGATFVGTEGSDGSPTLPLTSYTIDTGSSSFTMYVDEDGNPTSLVSDIYEIEFSMNADGTFDYDYYLDGELIYSGTGIEVSEEQALMNMGKSAEKEIGSVAYSGDPMPENFTDGNQDISELKEDLKMIYLFWSYIKQAELGTKLNIEDEENEEERERLEAALEDLEYLTYLTRRDMEITAEAIADIEAQQEATCTDADGDGYYDENDCGTKVDCNDDNPAINPGVAEICDNGVDDDCDGYIDCDDEDCFSDTGCDRFEDLGDGTVRDNRTGLIWLKTANAYQWLSWDDAMNAAANLSSGEYGLSDGSVDGEWRLPTKEEMQGLGTDPPTTWNSGYPSVTWTPPESPFTNVPNVHVPYWTSTEETANDDLAWCIYIETGNTNTGIYKTNEFHWWPVRSGN